MVRVFSKRSGTGRCAAAVAGGRADLTIAVGNDYLCRSSTRAQNPQDKPYVRLLKPEELPTLGEIAQRAFIDDPDFYYFGNVQARLSNNIDSPERQNLGKFTTFLARSGWLLGARINVLVVPTGGTEKIVAFATWLPPRNRLALWMVFMLVRAGIIPVLMAWGIRGFTRMASEYLDKSEKSLVNAYRTRRIKGSHSDSWYLRLAATDPDYQGKGYMSMLIREALAYSPSSIYTLVATTAHSRDIYQRFGFEVTGEIILGPGIVNASGLPTTSPQDATGVTCYSMIREHKTL